MKKSDDKYSINHNPQESELIDIILYLQKRNWLFIML